MGVKAYVFAAASLETEVEGANQNTVREREREQMKTEGGKAVLIE